MSQQKSKNLINWELVTVNPNNKNWDWKDLFCYWGVNIQSVIGFSLITSLYLIYNLNTFVVIFGTLLGTISIFFLKYNWQTFSEIWITICCSFKIFFRL